jgi:NTE family protein
MPKPTHAGKPKIGLALGSGSARGWAHFGVFQALSELGIQVDFIAGASIGALAGAVFASGSTNALLEIIPQLEWKRVASFFDLVFPRSGLIDGKRIADFVRLHVKETDIRDLPIPFRAVAADLSTGEEVIFDRGDVIEAVRASMSFPGVLTPARKGDSFLIDGGLVNPVPVSVVREMGADIVIAVDLNHDIVAKKGVSRKAKPKGRTARSVRWAGRKLAERSKFVSSLNERLERLEVPLFGRFLGETGQEPLPNIFDVLLSSISIMENQITAAKLKAHPPDILLQPELGHIRFLEFQRAREGISAGYEEAMLKLGEWLER